MVCSKYSTQLYHVISIITNQMLYFNPGILIMREHVTYQSFSTVQQEDSRPTAANVSLDDRDYNWVMYTK